MAKMRSWGLFHKISGWILRRQTIMLYQPISSVVVLDSFFLLCDRTSFLSLSWHNQQHQINMQITHNLVYFFHSPFDWATLRSTACFHAMHLLTSATLSSSVFLSPGSLSSPYISKQKRNWMSWELRTKKCCWCVVAEWKFILRTILKPTFSLESYSSKLIIARSWFVWNVTSCPNINEQKLHSGPKT